MSLPSLTATSDCIAACTACADACDRCFAGCLEEQDVGMMARCIALDADCAAACRFAVGAMQRGSMMAGVICQMCAQVCEACAEECGCHEHDHCRQCAEACRACAQACGAMAA